MGAATSLAVRLDKGHFVDFLESGEAAPNAIQRRFPQKLHTFLLRQLAHFGGRFLLENHLANRIGQVEQLVDGSTSAIAGAAALHAAPAFLERKAAPLTQVQARKLQFRV